MSMLLRAGLLLVAHLQLLEGYRRASFDSIRQPVPGPPGSYWNYLEHGSDWVQGSCPSRVRQSPIDFDEALLNPPGAKKLSYSYAVVMREFDIRNNGHAIAGDLTGRGVGGITFDNAHYDLLSINFHSLSEHTFHGVHKPVEIHLVHKKTGSDAVVVVAIPVESMTPIALLQTGNRGFLQRSNRSAAAMHQNPIMDKIGAGPYMVPNPDAPHHNPDLQAFLRSTLPNPEEAVKAEVSEATPMDINAWMEGGTFMEYSGSLTAPPCSEIVTWFVRREPIKASDDQVLVIHDELFRISNAKGNFREVKPLQNRPIVVREGVKEKPTIPPPDPAIPIGPNPRLDNEARAMKEAQNSLANAKAARDYVNDLDSRMQAAAIAHANAIAPDLMPENPVAAGGTVAPTEPPPPMDMEKQSAIISQGIADAAKEAITNAAQQIAIEARKAAASAAKEASKMASGQMPSLPHGGAPAAATPAPKVHFDAFR